MVEGHRANIEYEATDRGCKRKRPTVLILFVNSIDSKCLRVFPHG